MHFSSPRRLYGFCWALIGCCLPLADAGAQVSARSMAMGGIVSVLDDPATACTGMAALAGRRVPGTGIVYVDGFGVREMAVKQLFVIVPAAAAGLPGFWTGAASLQHFGFSQYHETGIGLSAGGRLHPRIPVGIGCELAHAGTGNGRSTWHLSGGMGCQWLPGENICIGLTVNHLTAAGRAILPQTYRHAVFHAGCSRRLSERTLAALEWQWQGRQAGAHSWHAGFEFEPVDRLLLRCGWYSGRPASCSLGMGWQGRRWCVDLALATHPYLNRNLSFTLCRTW